jgi:hypothetical protein
MKNMKNEEAKTSKCEEKPQNIIVNNEKVNENHSIHSI